jgi:hypothetical protein
MVRVDSLGLDQFPREADEVGGRELLGHRPLSIPQALERALCGCL